MSQLLHLLTTSAEEQTRQIHRMLVEGIGQGFESETRTLNSGGEMRNLPVAVLKLRRNKPELTYAWGVTALTAAVLAGHPRILFSPDRFSGPKSLRWIRSLMSRGDVTFVSPTFTQQRLAILHGIDPDRCRVIQPGVDFGKLRRRDTKLRTSLGLSENDFVLIAPGESTIQTGHEQAVWTCGILHVLDPNCKLLIWGRGRRAATVMELADRLNQRDMVKIAETSANGPIPFEEVLPAADACLVTAAGAAPTLPIATVMAAGVPIISTVTYMLAELLEDRHTALMVPRRSPRALAQRVLDLREDPTLRARLIDTARAEAYEHFSMTKMLDEYRNLLINPPSTRAGAPDVHPGLYSPMKCERFS